MNKKRKSQLITTIIAVVLILGLIIGIYFAIKWLTALKGIQIAPDFAEQELDIEKDYTFSVVTNPKNASLKNVEYIVDNGYASVTVSETEKRKFTIHTKAEGTITVVVRDWDTETESNSLTFSVVDQERVAAEAAAAQAKAEEEARLAAEAQAQAEAEAAAAAAQKYVVTTDKVKVRATPGTDGEVKALVDIGEVFKKIEDVEDWTKLEYDDEEAYIKTEFLIEVTEEEVEQKKIELEEQKQKEEKKKEEKKEEETKKEESSNNTQTTDDTAAKAAEQKAVADKQAADLLAQQQAVAAATAVSGHTFTDKNGETTTFTNAEWNKLRAQWEYTGMAEEMISHHTCGELRTVLASLQ